MYTGEDERYVCVTICTDINIHSYINTHMHIIQDCVNRNHSKNAGLLYLGPREVIILYLDTAEQEDLMGQRRYPFSKMAF